MKNKKQFTLIELIIVIVVIGILAAMALPKFNGVVRNTKLAAMLQDKETLEKTLILYYQKNDTLPLLNEDEELIANENIGLTKIVLAEDTQNGDMDTIYKSLKETLTYYNDSEETLYRINLPKLKDSLSKNIKYGHKKTDKDFYVYSTKTGNVYYYDYVVNGNGTIQHNEYDTLLKNNELVEKKFSYNLDNNGNTINNKPIVELSTSLEGITNDTIIKWEYTFSDEDKSPMKISFILNDTEYDSLDKVPTKLEGGDYTIKIKMQDSKGLWSDEIVKSFSVSKNILKETIGVYFGNGTGGGYDYIGFFDKEGNFVVENLKLYKDAYNSRNIYFQYSESQNYKEMENYYIEITTTAGTQYNNWLNYTTWIKPTSFNYKMPLKGISSAVARDLYPPSTKLFKLMYISSNTGQSDKYWAITKLKISKQ